MKNSEENNSDTIYEIENAMHKLWDSVENSLINSDSDHALVDVLNRIESNEMVRWQHSRKTYRILLSAAAVFVCLITVTAYAFFSNSHTTVIPQYATLIYKYVPKGEIQEFVLEDGSIISLNSGSTLIFPETFVGKKREVHLIGEAYFKVAKDHARPFIVHTSDMDIEALGTEFCVNSYPDDKNITASLTEGSIRVTPLKSDIGSAILHPGLQAILGKNGEHFEICHIKNESSSSWRDGLMIFENNSLSEFVTILERQRNVKILYAELEGYDFQIVAKFKKTESVDEILREVGQVCGFKALNRSNEYILTKTTRR